MNKQSNEYISKALKIANDLMGLAGDGDTLADNPGCGILFGIMRDCAYKIRRQAERERQAHKAKGDWGPHILKMQPEQSFNLGKLVMILGVVLILGAAVARPVNASTIILSTDATETLGGLTFSDGGLADYDSTTDTAALYFNESLFGGNENINAVHVLNNGNIILSTASGATLGGLTFGNGDLIEYNPTTDTATLYFDESMFVGSNEDIDAVHILDTGNIILSTIDVATLGGLTFGAGDLIEYNPTTDTGTLFLDGTLFGGGEDIDAVHILDNGNIILSTEGAATLGGLTFADGALAEYNPTTDTATLYFDENLFSNNADIDAVHVATLPEPATVALLGLGSLVLIRRRRKQAKHDKGSGLEPAS